MIKPTSESDRIIKWTARPPWRAMTTNPYWTLGTGMSPHARTHAHARTGTRPGAIGTNGTPDHNWRNLHNWRKFRHWRNCRDWANWHTYLMRSWHSWRDWRDSHWRSYVRSRVRSVRHYVFSCAPIRRLAAAVHYVPQSAPAPITPNSAATVHYLLQKNCRSEPRGAPWLIALC